MNAYLNHPSVAHQPWLSKHPFFTRINRRAENFALNFPFLTFLLVFIGMPIFILLCVVLLSTAVVLPISYFMGAL
ncbi:MAG: hypothetical protein RR865_10160 [Clostridia bacterium]